MFLYVYRHMPFPTISAYQGNPLPPYRLHPACGPYGWHPALEYHEEVRGGSGLLSVTTAVGTGISETDVEYYTTQK